jgi:hypothetical protein
MLRLVSDTGMDYIFKDDMRLSRIEAVAAFKARYLPFEAA